jgi:hypothetical protein
MLCGHCHAAAAPTRHQQAPQPRLRPPAPFGTHIDENCYVCGRRIAADAKVRQFHEIMVHETRYLQHLRP